jgi:hypothetical protein
MHLMNSASMTQTLHTRPKVFRPPAALFAEPVASDDMPRSPLSLVFPLGAGALLIAIFLIAISHQSPAPKALTAQNAGPDMTLAEPRIILSPPVAEAVTASLPVEKQGKIIALQGQSGAIIGQMAKIPSENEQITEIRPVSEVDKNAGRELLSIVSKY